MLSRATPDSERRAVLTNRRSFTFAPMVGSMDFRAGRNTATESGLHSHSCPVTVVGASGGSSQGPKQEGSAMIKQVTWAAATMLLLVAALYPGAAVAHEGADLEVDPCVRWV